jgi:hypothetical protein
VAEYLADADLHRCLITEGARGATVGTKSNVFQHGFPVYLTTLFFGLLHPSNPKGFCNAAFCSI